MRTPSAQRSARRCSSAPADRSPEAGEPSLRGSTIARLKLKLQLYCGDEVAMGPGKADLLEALAREGSISAAARALGMSYRRAWVLVDQMNRCFTHPLVETQAGGGRRAGARLTAEGEAALRAYRELSAQVEQVAQGSAVQALNDALRERPLPTRDG